MFHFRSTVALRELFHSHLQRPLAARAARRGAPAAAARTGGRSPGRGRALSAWTAPPRAAGQRGTRGFCSKDEAAKDSSSEKRRKAGILPSLEDLLFYTIAEGQEKIPAHKFTTALKATGLRTGDPRLKECMEMLKVTMKTTSDGTLDRHLFKKAARAARERACCSAAGIRRFDAPSHKSAAASPPPAPVWEALRMKIGTEWENSLINYSCSKLKMPHKETRRRQKKFKQNLLLWVCHKK